MRHRACKKSHMFDSHIKYSNKHNDVSVRKSRCDRCGAVKYTWSNGTYKVTAETIGKLSERLKERR